MLAETLIEMIMHKISNSFSSFSRGIHSILWKMMIMSTMQLRQCMPIYVGRVGSLADSSSIVWEGRGFESRSVRHVGTLNKSCTHNCLWRFGVKFRHSSELEEAL